jgi:hypothetical protein
LRLRWEEDCGCKTLRPWRALRRRDTSTDRFAEG